MAITDDPDYLAWRRQAFPEPPAAEFAGPCDRHAGLLGLSGVLFDDPADWTMPHEISQGEDVYITHKATRKRIVFVPDSGRYVAQAGGSALAATLGTFGTADAAADFIEQGQAKAETPRSAKPGSAKRVDFADPAGGWLAGCGRLAAPAAEF